MNRIVVIRTSALGDTVLATPVLRALRARWPEAEIHFVTSGVFAPLFEGLPGLTRVWRWEPSGRHVGLRGLSRFAEEIRSAGPFDLAVDLQNKVRTRLLVSLLRPARRITWVKRRGVAAVARALVGDDEVIDRGPAAALYLEALGSLALPQVDLRPAVAIPRAAEEAAERLLAPAEGARVVALAPGARWALKRWAPERFAAVGDALASDGFRIVLAGGPGDLPEIDAVRTAMEAVPVGDTAGLDVAGLAAVLARAELLVTADSAPSHLAQAVGTPVVAVFGPTSANRWGPLPDAGAALALPLACGPCTNHGRGSCPLGQRSCLDDLPAEPVIRVARAALAAGRAEGGRAAHDAAAACIDALARIAALGSEEADATGRLEASR